MSLLPPSQKQFQITALLIKSRQRVFLLIGFLFSQNFKEAKQEPEKMFSKSSELFWFHKRYQ